jgi:hypothetical protein
MTFVIVSQWINVYFWPRLFSCILLLTTENQIRGVEGNTMSFYQKIFNVCAEREEWESGLNECDCAAK